MRTRTAQIAFTIAASLVVLTGCAGGSRSGGNPVRPSSIISTAEIERAQSSGVLDLYQLIERLQPLWLQIRSQRSLRRETVILVYHNNARLGGIEALRGYPLTSVTSVRYLDSAEAGVRLGVSGSNVEGAIVISTSSR